MQFSSIPGQERAKKSIIQAFKEKRIPHALLLTGPDGVGDLAFAMAIAARIYCENPNEEDSCGVCSNCSRVSRMVYPDLHFVFPHFVKSQKSAEDSKDKSEEDPQTALRRMFMANPFSAIEEWTEELSAEKKNLVIGIEFIRELRRKITLKSFEGHYKVVIVWMASKINGNGANAFLKVLEEPPDRTVFILTAGSNDQLLPTIRSRCQGIMLQRTGLESIAHFLQTSYAVQSERAFHLAQISDGNLAKAIRLSNEQTGSLSGLFRSWMRACYTYKQTSNTVELLTIVESLAKQTREFHKLLFAYALQNLRACLLMSNNADSVNQLSPNDREFIEKFSILISPAALAVMIALLEDNSRYLENNANPSLVYLDLSLALGDLLVEGKTQVQLV